MFKPSLPSIPTFKVAEGGIASAVVATFAAGCVAINDALRTGVVNHMIFENQIVAGWIGTVLALVFVIAIKYFFRYQVYKKEHPDRIATTKFEIKYVVAIICTIAVSFGIIYIIDTFGISYLFPNVVPIEQFGLALIMSFVIAGVICWLVDATIFHPIVDGTAAMFDAKAEKELREKILSEENLKKAKEALAAQAKSFGLTDQVKIDAYVESVKEEDTIVQKQAIANAIKGLSAEQLQFVNRK